MDVMSTLLVIIKMLSRYASSLIGKDEVDFSDTGNNGIDFDSYFL